MVYLLPGPPLLKFPLSIQPSQSNLSFPFNYSPSPCVLCRFKSFSRLVPQTFGYKPQTCTIVFFGVLSLERLEQTFYSSNQSSLQERDPFGLLQYTRKSGFRNTKNLRYQTLLTIHNISLGNLFGLLNSFKDKLGVFSQCRPRVSSTPLFLFHYVDSLRRLFLFSVVFSEVEVKEEEKDSVLRSLQGSPR